MKNNLQSRRRLNIFLNSTDSASIVLYLSRTHDVRTHGWKTKGEPISFLRTLALILYIISGVPVPATAAENQTMIINADEHSELAHRLLLDANGNEERRSSVQIEGSENLVSAEKAESVFHDFTNKYFITDLGTLGGSESFAYAISDSGFIVGSSRTKGDTTTHSFVYRNGRMIDLYPLNSQSTQTVGPTGINNFGRIASGAVINDTYSPAVYDIKTHKTTMLGTLGGVSNSFNGVATSINNSGQAVGYSYIDNINRHAFLYRDGVTIDIGSFGGYSGANAINDKGMIVGFASDQYNGRAHAFIYSNGLMTDIDPYLDFSRSESYARDVNNRGQVVGEFLTKDQSATHAFMYNKGVLTDLVPASSSPYTAALGINDRKQVVGITDIPYVDTCFDPDLRPHPCIKYKQHAFIYAKGQLTDLNTLIAPRSGWELTWAFDINNQGKIVGYGLKNGKFRAFLLTPLAVR